MKTASIAAAAACALFAVQVGATFDVEPMRTVVVTYNELDLGSKAAQAELRKRLHAAALHVCSAGHFLSLICYDETIVEALDEADRVIKKQNGRSASTLEASTINR